MSIFPGFPDTKKPHPIKVEVSFLMGILVGQATASKSERYQGLPGMFCFGESGSLVTTQIPQPPRGRRWYKPMLLLIWFAPN